MDYLEDTGTDIVKAENEHAKDVFDHLVCHIVRTFDDPSKLDKFSDVAKNREDRKHFLIWKGVVGEGNVLYVPQGSFVWERTLGNATVAGVKISIVETSSLAIRNWSDMAATQNEITRGDETNQANVLRSRFFENVMALFPVAT